MKNLHVLRNFSVVGIFIYMLSVSTLIISEDKKEKVEDKKTKEEYVDAVVAFSSTSSKNDINKSCSSTCSAKKLKYLNDYKVKPKAQCKCG